MKQQKEKKILVVEDDAAFRRSLRKILQRAGYQVKDACTGTQALEMICSETYHLIVADLNLPGKSGFAILREAKRRSPESKVIILTVESEPAKFEEAMKNGAFAFLSKPIKMKKMLTYADRAFANAT